MAVNVRGVFLCLKHQIPFMLETAEGKGAIVITSSTAGLGADRWLHLNPFSAAATAAATAAAAATSAVDVVVCRTSMYCLTLLHQYAC